MVGITFGPLLSLGTYVVQTQELFTRPLVVGVPLAGILIATVLWSNEFPDYEADRRANKRNLVVRLGRARARVVYAWLVSLAELAVIGVALYLRSPWMLLGLAGSLEASRAARVCWLAYDSTAELMPANAGTVKTYVLTGAGLLAGALLQHWLPV